MFMHQLVHLLLSILHYVFSDMRSHCQQNVPKICHVEVSLYRPVLYASLVFLCLASLFPKDWAVVVEMIEGFILLLSEPRVEYIQGLYYAIHVVQIVVQCCGIYKKHHITFAEPRNYLPYLTIWSIIK